MLQKILFRIMQEFAGWKWYEVVYTLLCTLAIMLISICLGDNILGIASAVAGTLYTLLAGKGKISCYIFGIFNSAVYGYIAFENSIYGDAMLNWLWYLPMMFAGIIFWSRKMDAGGCVIKNSLSWSGRFLTLFLCAAGIAGYAFLLRCLNGAQPVTDAATTVFSVAAMILTVRRCVEQWLMWILVNSISVYMWARIFLAHGNSAATLLWWLIMLITGIIFFIRWTSDMKRETVKC